MRKNARRGRTATSSLRRATPPTVTGLPRVMWPNLARATLGCGQSGNSNQSHSHMIVPERSSFDGDGHGGRGLSQTATAVDDIFATPTISALSLHSLSTRVIVAHAPGVPTPLFTGKLIAAKYGPRPYSFGQKCRLNQDAQQHNTALGRLGLLSRF